MSPYVKMALLVIGEITWGYLCSKLFVAGNDAFVWFISNIAATFLLGAASFLE